MINNKKRFLYVGGFQLPDKNAAAHRVLSIARILSMIGYEVVFLDVDDEREDYGLSEEHIEAGYSTYSQKRPGGMKRWASYVLNPLHVEGVLDKYTDWEGVIAYNYPAMALQKLKKICQKRNIKVYADCTEWYQYGMPRSVRDVALIIDTFFRMRIVQKRLDGIIVISNYLKNYYESSLPVVNIPPLVDKQDAKWVEEINEVEDNRIKLAYAGSPGRSKDKLNVMIRAVGECRNNNLHLDIVGITKEEYLEYYPEEIRLLESSEAKERLTFWGRVPHMKALEIVKSSDYTVFYRAITKVSMAGFPTKFVESISCGVPVITNQTSDLNQYIRENKNGVLLSTENFENELQRLLKDMNRIDMKCEVEEQRFDYRNYVKQLEEWLRKCD